MISEKDISTGLDESFQKAGGNAYFGNGFKAGVEFALKFEEKNNNKFITGACKEVYCQWNEDGICNNKCSKNME